LAPNFHSFTSEALFAWEVLLFLLVSTTHEVSSLSILPAAIVIHSSPGDALHRAIGKIRRQGYRPSSNDPIQLTTINCSSLEWPLLFTGQSYRPSARFRKSGKTKAKIYRASAARCRRKFSGSDRKMTGRRGGRIFLDLTALATTP
jgi:hypothetical protein